MIGIDYISTSMISSYYGLSKRTEAIQSGSERSKSTNFYIVLDIFLPIPEPIIYLSQISCTTCMFVIKIPP